jgi:hypothetical protein
VCYAYSSGSVTLIHSIISQDGQPSESGSATVVARTYLIRVKNDEAAAKLSAAIMENAPLEWFFYGLKHFKPWVMQCLGTLVANLNCGEPKDALHSFLPSQLQSKVHGEKKIRVALARELASHVLLFIGHVVRSPLVMAQIRWLNTCGLLALLVFRLCAIDVLLCANTFSCVKHRRMPLNFCNIC